MRFDVCKQRVPLWRSARCLCAADLYRKFETCSEVCLAKSAMAFTLLAHPSMGPIHRPSRLLWRNILRVSERKNLTAQRMCGCKQPRRQTRALALTDASTKVLKETAALDQLIDLFLAAKSQQQVCRNAHNHRQAPDQPSSLKFHMQCCSWPSLSQTTY